MNISRLFKSKAFLYLLWLLSSSKLSKVKKSMSSSFHSQERSARASCNVLWQGRAPMQGPVYDRWSKGKEPLESCPAVYWHADEEDQVRWYSYSYSIIFKILGKLHYIIIIMIHYVLYYHYVSDGEVHMCCLNVAWIGLDAAVCKHVAVLIASWVRFVVRYWLQTGAKMKQSLCMGRVLWAFAGVEDSRMTILLPIDYYNLLYLKFSFNILILRLKFYVLSCKFHTIYFFKGS